VTSRKPELRDSFEIVGRSRHAQPGRFLDHGAAAYTPNWNAGGTVVRSAATDWTINDKTGAQAGSFMENRAFGVLATALLMIFFWARLFALRVQDRVIRLEMHLRVANLAPDLSARFGEFTLNQLCAMRFASDAELPELARKVLSEKLDDRTAIKKMVRDWQADHARA